MFQFSRWSIAGAALVTSGLAAGAIIPSTAVFATSNTGVAYPDIQNHWAQPFIQRLTEQQILAGYPDGTFRPEIPVNRDEYAAILRQAFNQSAERQIASGSVYRDVPQGYWASDAIEEAYQMGFMQGYPGGYFRPDQGITRTEVLVSLARNLDLTDNQPENQSVTIPATQPQANAPANLNPSIPQAITENNAEGSAVPQASAAVQPNNQPTNQQPIRRRNNRRPFAIPMAMTTLMQPFVNATAAATNLAAPAAQAQAPTPPPAEAVPAAETPAPNTAAQDPIAQSPPLEAETPQATAQTTAAQPQQPVSFVVSNYYADANQIPQYAVDSIARVTQAGIVVNYPETNLLNPTRPATRGEVAAFIHQALVDQGRLQPLPNQTEAANFVVVPE